MTINRLFTFTTVFVMSMFISSCMFPEEFKSEVNINKDGTFTFEYKGTLTFVMGRAEEVESGKLTLDDSDIEDLKNELAEDKGFESIEYIGHSKFKVKYNKNGKLTEPFNFIDESIKIFSIAPKDDGVIEVKGIKLNKSDIKKLKKIKLTIDGELKLSTNGKVIEHNASSTPSLFGLIGGYVWVVKSLDDPQPKILIDIK